MTAPHQHPHHTEPVDLDKRAASDPHAGHAGHGGHGWMMIACCIPMIIIAVALVATGVAGPGFIVVALMCTAMMTLMMKAMND